MSYGLTAITARHLAVTVMSRLAELLAKRGPAWTWNVTVRVTVLGFSLVLLYRTARSASGSRRQTCFHSA